MPRLVKLNGRRLGEAPDDVGVYLLTFEHPDLADPVRLSTDPTDLITLEPYVRGTRSRGDVFTYVIMNALLPDDRETGTTTTTLVIANIDAKIGQVLRSIRSPATVTIEIVEATEPDYVLDLITGLEMIRATITDVAVQVEIGRPSYATDAYPKGRMTKDRFPGLLR